MFTHVAAARSADPLRGLSIEVLQIIRRLLIRSDRFRLEREFAGPDSTGENDAPCQGTQNNRAEKCSGSNRPDQPSASCPFTPPFTTRSTSSVISHPAARLASYETKRSGRGEPPPRPEVQLAFQTPRRADPSWCDSALSTSNAISRQLKHTACNARRR
jgi:hypothetical protein